MEADLQGADLMEFKTYDPSEQVDPAVDLGKRERGQPRMALKLGHYLSGFVFPIAIAVLRVFEFVSRLR